MRRLLFLAVLLATTLATTIAGAWTHGVVPTSLVGMNLAEIDFFATVQPLTDISVMTDQWRTSIVSGSFNSASSSPLGGMTLATFDTSEEPSVVVDGNGQPTALTASGKTFNALTLVMSYALPAPYYTPGSGNSGTYDVYYSPGNCNWIYSQDVTSVTRNVAGGHDVISVTPSAGIFMTMTQTGSGASQCIKQGVTYSTLTSTFRSGCLGGGTAVTANINCFNPKYVAFLKSIGITSARFKDWMCTDNNTSTSASTWATRPTLSTPFYASISTDQSGMGQPSIPCGVPAELMIALANYLDIDMWVSMPALAATSYATGMATLVNSNLNSNLRVHMEYSNETWNGIFQSSQQVQTLGNSAFGCGMTFLCGRSWMGYQTQQMCSAWTAVFPSSRFDCVLSAQAGNSGTYTQALSCASAPSPPCTAGVNSIAIGPYYGALDFPSAWTANADGGLGCLFMNLGLVGPTCATGMLPNGSGTLNTTGGSASALTLTSGQSLSGTPANGTCVQFKFGTTPNNGATLAVDGVTATALTDNAGNNVSNSLASNNGSAWLACYTSSTSAGGVGPYWAVLYNNTIGASGGWLATTEGYMDDLASDITNTYPTLVAEAYEGGPSLSNSLNSAVIQTMLNAAALDTRMGIATSLLFTHWKGDSGHEFHYFNDINAPSQYGQFGVLSTLCTPDCSLSSVPTSAKLSGLTAWIAQNPRTYSSFP